MKNNSEIERLEGEVSRLKSELEKAHEREELAEGSRRIILNMMEEVNESAEGIARGKKEWEATFDAVSDPLFIHDKEMRIIRANKAYLSASGEGEFEHIIGRPYYEVFPKMDSPFRMCSKALELREEVEEVSLPATSKVFRVRFYPVHGPAKEHLYSIHVMEDITNAKREEDRRKILYEFSNRVISSMDLDYRLKLICSTIVELGYRMVWIGTLKDDTKEVIPKSQAGFEDSYISTIRVRYDDSPLGQGPTGRAIKNKKPEFQNHIATDPLYEPWREAALKRGYGSSAALPIIHENKVIAVLNIYNSNETFPEKEINFLQTFANQTATALKNAQLFEEVKGSAERIRQEMEVTTHLLMIADAVAGTTDIDRLMEQVVHCGHKITGCDICLSYLWDKESNAFQPCQEFGLPRELLPIFKTESLDMKAELVKQALKKKSPVIEKAGEVREPTLQWIADINTIAVIPLIGKKGSLGLILGIYVETPRRGVPTEFTERDINLMQGISHQVSTALEEASLYKESTDRAMELSHKIETIKVMHEIDRSILSTLASTEILETVTRMIGRLIPCDRATIALVDKERKGFTYEAGFGLSFIQKGALVLFDETLTTEVVTTGRPQYIQNLEIVKEPLPFEQRLLKDGFLSHIRLPLAVKGEVVGVLSVGAKRLAAFTAESLATLEYLASQIGVALENSRLVTDLEELFIGTVKSLSSAIDAKSPWTAGHSERVTRYALDIGREMGLSEKELKQLELAGILHDVGKIGTYEAILDKPGRLTEDELKIMRLHPGKGAEILGPIKNLKDMIPAIRHHHEFYNGTGYPDGLKEEKIPLFARILTVADTADAMGADRPYRKGRGMDVIIAELKRCSGTQFDPIVVDVFLKTLQNKPF